MIMFTIPEALPVLNSFTRMTHWQRTELRARCSALVDYRAGLNACK